VGRGSVGVVIAIKKRPSTIFPNQAHQNGEEQEEESERATKKQRRKGGIEGEDEEGQLPNRQRARGPAALTPTIAVHSFTQASFTSGVHDRPSPISSVCKSACQRGN
jgi:hypothetical protein